MSNYICINGHRNDHTNLDMCATPGCHAEAEIDEAPDPWPLVRESVRWFAGEMEQELRHHDDKTGWIYLDKVWLLRHLAGELVELSMAASKENIIHEAADVANFAMMIADNARATLKRREGVGT